MRNAVVTAKDPKEGWLTMYNGENIAEAKACYRGLKLDMKDYLQISIFLAPNQRRVSRLGRVSEAELKEQAKIKREKEKHIAKELKKKAEAKAKAEEAAEKEAAEVAKAHVERRAKEKKEQLKMKAANAKAKADKEAAKHSDIADAVVERISKKK